MGFVGRFEFLFGAVDQFAQLGAFLGREFAHLLGGERERSFAAKRLYANGFQLLERCGGGHARERAGFQFLDGLIEHGAKDNCNRWGRACFGLPAGHSPAEAGRVEVGRGY